jgi:hypothetical protein
LTRSRVQAIIRAFENIVGDRFAGARIQIGERVVNVQIASHNQPSMKTGACPRAELACSYVVEIGTFTRFGSQDTLPEGSPP